MTLISDPNSATSTTSAPSPLKKECPARFALGRTRTVLTSTFLAANIAAAAALASPAMGQSRPAPGACAVAPEHRLARQNYTPDAPVRSVVGKGKVLEGVVRSSDGCRPVPGARLEFWLNTTALGGDEGEMNPANRATVVADEQGRYRFESDQPQRVWASAEPHVHIKVTAPGHDDLWFRFVTDENLASEDPGLVLRSWATGAGS